VHEHFAFLKILYGIFWYLLLFHPAIFAHLGSTGDSPVPVGAPPTGTTARPANPTARKSQMPHAQKIGFSLDLPGYTRRYPHKIVLGAAPVESVLSVPVQSQPVSAFAKPCQIAEAGVRLRLRHFRFSLWGHICVHSWLNFIFFHIKFVKSVNSVSASPVSLPCASATIRLAVSHSTLATS
jgi:hypothetical protein